MNKDNLNCSWVIGSTPVLLKNEAPEEIQYLQQGQEVLSRCKQTGEIGFQRIADIFIQKDVPTYLLYYKSSSAEKSDNHDLRAIEAAPTTSFFVFNKGWTLLKNIIAGDVIKSFDRTCFSSNSYVAESFNCATQTVVGIASSGLTRKVYSLSLDGGDAYFIREEGFLILEQTSESTALEKSSSDHKVTPHCSMGGFPSDALVPIKGGHISEIQFIMPGTEVLSRCVATGELSYRKVLRRVIHESIPAYSLTYDYKGRLQSVLAAAGQQFLLNDCGWSKVSEIKIGDFLQTSDGHIVLVKGVKEEVDEQHHYFNYCMLEIDGSDCFYVNDGLCARGFDSVLIDPNFSSKW